jgi:hypothetical protein
LVAALKATPSGPRNPHSVVQILGDTYDTWTTKQVVKEVSVELMTNQSSEGMLRVFDPDFKIIDKYSTATGVPFDSMLFSMGFGANLGPVLFTGLLTSVERDDTDTIFRAYDMAHKMKLTEKTEYHNKLKDVAIIQKLALRNGLQFEGPDQDPGTGPHTSLIQDSKHDWHLAHERAKAAGLVIYCRGNTLYAKQPATYTTPLVVLAYRQYPAGPVWMIHKWDARYKLPENTSGRHKQVHKYGRARGGKRLHGQSDVNQRGHLGVHMTKEIHQNVGSYANRQAQASKSLNREHAFVVAVRCPPEWPGVGPDNRDTVALTNFGKLFSGSYLIDKVFYNHNAHGIVVEFTLYRDIAQV